MYEKKSITEIVVEILKNTLEYTECKEKLVC